ncbi:MAG TPA: recombinase RecT [Bacteroidales bacterium]|mgnify:CR=1 FL=1|nr:recombinase RecT [Bacteroidales bacterium]
MSNIAIRKETIDIVTVKVKEFQNKGELYFPANYVPENALKSAWLMIQETQDKDKRSALEVCSKESIANSLLSMVIQGLNPDKKQCYFIVYGNKLQMQRSYFGSMAVAKSVDPDIDDIYGMVVYDGDEFEYEISKGKKIVTKHIQKIQNVQKDNIIAAYACVVYQSGKENHVIMTIDEIKQAWKMSKMNPVDEKGHIKSGSTHDKFTAEMCIKTVINRICKPIINSSSDKNIVARFAAQADAEIKELEVQEEIEENANKEIIDVSVDIQDVESEVVEENILEGPDF